MGSQKRKKTGEGAYRKDTVETRTGSTANLEALSTKIGNSKKFGTYSKSRRPLFFARPTFLTLLRIFKTCQLCALDFLLVACFLWSSRKTRQLSVRGQKWPKTALFLKICPENCNFILKMRTFVHNCQKLSPIANRVDFNEWFVKVIRAILVSWLNAFSKGFGNEFADLMGLAQFRRRCIYVSILNGRVPVPNSVRIVRTSSLGRQERRGLGTLMQGFLAAKAQKKF